MAISYWTFLSLYQWGGTVHRELNVSSWKEIIEPVGGLRRAFEGTMLSTVRSSKRHYEATVEFENGADYESFLAFISTSTNTATGAIQGLRKMNLLGVGTESSIRNHGLPCYVQPTSATPESSLNNSIVGLRWVVDVTIYEV